MAKSVSSHNRTGMAQMPASRCEPSKAKQLTAVFAKLQQLLLTEWPSIRTTNLGKQFRTTSAWTIAYIPSRMVERMCTLCGADTLSDAEQRCGVTWRQSCI